MDAYLIQEDEKYVLHVPKERKEDPSGLVKRVFAYIDSKRDPKAKLFRRACDYDCLNINYAADLEEMYARQAYEDIVNKDIKKYKRRLAINSTLLAVTAPTPIPLITIFFTYLVAVSYRRLEAAKSALDKAKFVPNPEIKTLEDILERESDES
jgi:hypothetical protein